VLRLLLRLPERAWPLICPPATPRALQRPADPRRSRRGACPACLPRLRACACSRASPAPPQKEDKVGSLFDRAKAAGAEQGTSEDLQAKGGAFSGAARTLDGGVRQVRARSHDALRMGGA
jgi:hypothetical protein